ncbi:hypothetical protein EJD97_009721 [Solanum chilense]|uniref:Uncharacterized protein n=1 Tax=Solanum chilense TaxID=4083 RepID=A0A6N2BIS1_SOLCI|nr:hypothetical protein EJD97_009721 [Solanum chilense]
MGNGCGSYLSFQNSHLFFLLVQSLLTYGKNSSYATDKSSRVEVYRMILAATIYRLWRERNMRVFQHQQKTSRATH